MCYKSWLPYLLGKNSICLPAALQKNQHSNSGPSCKDNSWNLNILSKDDVNQTVVLLVLDNPSPPKKKQTDLKEKISSVDLGKVAHKYFNKHIQNNILQTIMVHVTFSATAKTTAKT